MQMPQGHEGHGYTHEITDEEDEWIWMGGEADMSVIFHNLTGVNFVGRPAKAYADYMEWMRKSTSQAFPGRADPYANGKVIVLAEIRGQRIASHRFVAAERAAQPSVEAAVASSTAGGVTIGTAWTETSEFRVPADTAIAAATVGKLRGLTGGQTIARLK